jgi:hypothetical protein
MRFIILSMCAALLLAFNSNSENSAQKSQSNKGPHIGIHKMYEGGGESHFLELNSDGTAHFYVSESRYGSKSCYVQNGRWFKISKGIIISSLLDENCGLASSYSERLYEMTGNPKKLTPVGGDISFPSGIESACFCASVLNGSGNYAYNGDQLQKCRKMYKCGYNALVDCQNGSETVWYECIE